MPSGTGTSRRTYLTAGVTVLLACAAGILGFLAGRSPATTAPGGAIGAVAPAAAPVADAAGFVAALAGEWQGPQERLLIKNDKGVVEILRQTRLDGGEVRLDQLVAAPVRFEPAQRRLELETPDGSWQLTLIPGARRAQLSITYPDQRNVLYQ